VSNPAEKLPLTKLSNLEKTLNTLGDAENFIPNVTLDQSVDLYNKFQEMKNKLTESLDTLDHKRR